MAKWIVTLTLGYTVYSGHDAEDECQVKGRATFEVDADTALTAAARAGAMLRETCWIEGARVKEDTDEAMEAAMSSKLRTVFAVEVFGFDDRRFIPRSRAQPTTDMPKLWVDKQQAERTARIGHYGRSCRVVAFELMEDTDG